MRPAPPRATPHSALVPTASPYRSVVKRVGAMTDKVSKLSFLEAPFEAGHVYVKRGPWNEHFLAQFRTFPKGHDDACDALYACLEDYSRHVDTGFDRAAMGF